MHTFMSTYRKIVNIILWLVLSGSNGNFTYYSLYVYVYVYMYVYVYVFVYASLLVNIIDQC